jgi:curved DNA-binding protein CbpA
MYHPDVNPYGQEDFKKILIAYETLIHPTRKSSYDLKLKYHQNASQTIKTPGKKTWTFEEKELKRRQYYDEHIKKYAKPNTNTKATHAELKKNYNEFKYILYATPIAVALFLLIVNLAASPPKQKSIAALNNSVEVIVPKSLKMGDSPYLQHFGYQRYSKTDAKSLTIKNNTGLDIIVCLFSEGNFLRSCFIKDGFYAEIPQLPKKKILLQYLSGLNWDENHELKEVRLYGGFTKKQSFYRSNNETELGALNEITLLTGLNEGFENINEKQFFNKE